MNRQSLVEQIRQKQTYLCVGLDTDLTKMPKHLQGKPDAVVAFNKAIIDATKDKCVSYKINTAFYEAMGIKGWQAMEETVHYIPSTHLKIADAKRGDIGNTSSQYAKAFFETIPFDAITVAPYMGEDSIRPFLEYENKWTIVLGLTSNKGAKDFEMLKLVAENFASAAEEHLAPRRNEYLYEKVLNKVAQWGTADNLMFVVGATQATEFDNIRNILPDHFFLVPGVGFQGGSLEDISNHAMNKDCGILVNASRAIIYASSGDDFATEAGAIAEQYHAEMKTYLNQ
ncbi:MAG: orotidine-5'-phosphate decarboxylase [Chitinophagaceae bacterium]|nr:MAG: orotidine-5'-phosphate decarboxylase [Chitinophagaceae bacterium]